MDKRALAAVPRPHPPVCKTEKGIKYVCTVDIADIANIDTLILNVFEKKQKRFNPFCRVFATYEDYISQDLTSDKMKWFTGCLLNKIEQSRWQRIYNEKNTELKYATAVDENKVFEYFSKFFEKQGIYEPCSDADRTFNTYQKEIMNLRIKRKRQKKIEKIDSDMVKFGDLPDDYEKFIKDTVFSAKRYMFFDVKKHKAYCTGCGRAYELNKDNEIRHPAFTSKKALKHNKEIMCPYCQFEKIVIAKNVNFGRKNMYECQWSVLVQKYEDEVITRYFCHEKYWDNWKNPKIETRELYRTVHTKKESREYQYGSSTLGRRWSKYKESWNGYMNPAENKFPRSAILYRANIEKTLSDTWLKYSAMDIYLDKVALNIGNKEFFYLERPWKIDNWIGQYRNKPYIEKFLKVGLYRLTKEELTNNSVGFVNGNNPCEILGISKEEYKMLIKVNSNPSLKDVEILKYCKGIKETDYMELRYLSGYDHTAYKQYWDLMQFTTLHKIEKYITQNKMDYQQIHSYFDYIKWTMELGYDMKNTFNIYPKNHKEAHDTRYMEYQKWQDKNKRKMMRQYAKKIEKMSKDYSTIEAFNYQDKKLLIRLPRTSQEIKQEGEKLRHCVGTYIEDVGKGETLIFFIRRKSEPDKQYYTLEYRDGKVKQCHGYGNRGMDDDVREFVEKWKVIMRNYEIKQRRKAG